MIKLKIVSDGTSGGTYVCDSETGVKVAGVQLISWSCSSDQVESDATLHIWGVPCEITGTPDMITVDDVIDEYAFETIPDEFSITGDEDKVIDISALIKGN